MGRDQGRLASKRRRLDRALAGLPWFSAGAGCHAQAMGADNL